VITLSKNEEKKTVCDLCSIQKRKLITIFDMESNIEKKICEDCLILRELEAEVISDLNNDDHRRVLIDYESFAINQTYIFPYRWFENFILISFLDRKDHIYLDSLLSEWPFKVNLENVVIPNFVKWGIVKPITSINEDGVERKIIQISEFIRSEFNNQLKQGKENGRIDNFKTIFRLIDGRITLGVETQGKFKNVIRWKLMKAVLRSGFDKDGRIKEDRKLILSKEFRCKICNERADFKFKTAEHVNKYHTNLSDTEKDAAIHEETYLAGIIIPWDDIIAIDEIQRYSASFRDQVVELIKHDSFFSLTHSLKEKVSDNDIIVLNSPWTRVLEKVNVKVKDIIKAKTMNNINEGETASLRERRITN